MKRTPLLLASLAATILLCGFAFILDDTWDPSRHNYIPTGLPIKWPRGNVTVVVMQGSTPSPLTDSSFATAIQAAADNWNPLLGDLKIVTRTANGTPTDGNSVNEVSFNSTIYGKAFDKNVLAVTTTSIYGGGFNQRAEADLIFNTAYNWDVYSGANKSNPVDLRRVATHELGHLLGLGHPDEATPAQSVSAIMNSHVSGLETPTQDDTEGVQNLYGPTGVPANDNFANAIEVKLPNTSLKATVNGFNTNATREPGEPINAGNSGGRSVWWKWTAPYDGNATMDTKGSYFDTILGVYTGSSVSALTAVGAQDMADDISAGSYAQQTFHIQASQITFPVTANTTYYFSVDGFNSSQVTYGADSAGITLNLNYTPTGGTAPAITGQPANQTVSAGGSATFSVTVSGTAPLTYQWFLGGSAIADATSSSYTVSNAQSGNAGNYTVTITNVFGTVTSNIATLTVNPVVVTPPPASSGGGGGGGGGAPSDWFLGALAALALLRWKQRRH